MSAIEALVGNMTLAELARFANTSVEAIVGAVLRGSAANGGAVDSKRRETSSPPGKVTRGGLRLDRVLASLVSVGGPAKLEDVRARTGGSVPQVRAALQKLAKSGNVKITGERRGTRYAAR